MAMVLVMVMWYGSAASFFLRIVSRYVCLSKMSSENEQEEDGKETIRIWNISAMESSFNEEKNSLNFKRDKNVQISTWDKYWHAENWKILHLTVIFNILYIGTLHELPNGRFEKHSLVDSVLAYYPRSDIKTKI